VELEDKLKEYEGVIAGLRKDVKSMQRIAND